MEVEHKKTFSDDDDNDNNVRASTAMNRETGILYLFGPIGTENAFTCVESIISANLSSQYNFNFITLVINSVGGCLDDAFSIIDTMEGSKIPIRTVGLGLVASAALMIFMSGRKGYRSLTPNTSILSHQWSWGVMGKRHELVSSQNQFDIIDKKVYNLYKKKTILSKADIHKVLLPPNDVWLTPQQALEYGMCDEIKMLNNKLIT